MFLGKRPTSTYIQTYIHTVNAQRLQYYFRLYFLTQKVTKVFSVVGVIVLMGKKYPHAHSLKINVGLLLCDVSCQSWDVWTQFRF